MGMRFGEKVGCFISTIHSRIRMIPHWPVLILITGMFIPILNTIGFQLRG